MKMQNAFTGRLGTFFLIILMSSFAFLTACTSSEPSACLVASTKGSVIEPKLGRQIDQALQDELKEGVFSGAVLITKGNTPILRRGYGCQDREKEILNSPDIISDIGSLAKTFTAVGVLLLEAQGKLELSDTLSNFYPNAPEEVGKITIEQVMLHIAGLKNYINLSDFAPMTRSEAEEKILNRSLKFEPGEDYDYSNSGYTLLAAIIERVSGESFQAFIRREIIVPIGLKDTGYYQGEGVDVSRLANGYGGWAGRLMGLWGGWRFGHTTYSKPLTWTLMGAGGMVSTVDDMQRWFRALSDSDKLPESVRKKMFTKTSAQKSLGHWQTIKIKGVQTVQMNGATVFGYIAKVLYLPETDITVLIAFNSHSNKYGVRTIHEVSHSVILPIIKTYADNTR